MDKDYETRNDALSVYVGKGTGGERVSLWWSPNESSEPFFVSTKPAAEKQYVTLEPGDNYLGFLLEKLDGEGKYQWAGFKWVRVDVSESAEQNTDQQTDWDLSLEECDITRFLSYEIVGPTNKIVSDNSPCSHDCRAKINVTVDADTDVYIIRHAYQYGRDIYGWSGERWEGSTLREPGEVDTYGWYRRYAINDDCQWLNQGISKLVATKAVQGCSWIDEQYHDNYEDSGLEMLEIESPCPDN